VSRREDRPAPGAMNCSQVSDLLPFFVCDELSAPELEAVAAHLASCATCAAQLEEERALFAIVSDAPQPADRLDPSGILLSQCRSELAEGLDQIAAPPAKTRVRPLAWLRRYMVLRPAWSAVFLVLLGIAVGSRISFLQTGEVDSGGSRVVRAAPPLTDEQLAKMAVAGIHYAPASGDEPGTVQLQLSAEQPYVLTGPLDDTGVRRVLTYVVENGQQFDAGTRLDCLDALRAATKEADVHRALLAAARKDGNPAVRLKALDALRESTEQPDVVEVYLDALEHDSNPGIRVEAVNVLVGSLERQGEASVMVLAPPPPRKPGTAQTPPPAPLAHITLVRVQRALENLTRNDPNRYVRLRSAAALRQIGPLENH